MLRSINCKYSFIILKKNMNQIYHYIIYLLCEKKKKSNNETKLCHIEVVTDFLLTIQNVRY